MRNSENIFDATQLNFGSDTTSNLSSDIFDKLQSKSRHNLDVSWKNFNHLQFIFGWWTYWNCLRNFSKWCKWILAQDKYCEGLKNVSRECDWISSTQQFGPILEKFGSYALEFWLGHKLGKFWTIFHKMQLTFGWDTNGICPRIFSIRCNWNSAQTQFQTVVGYFREDAIKFQLRHALDISWNKSDQMQLNLG